MGIFDFMKKRGVYDAESYGSVYERRERMEALKQEVKDRAKIAGTNVRNAIASEWQANKDLWAQRRKIENEEREKVRERALRAHARAKAEWDFGVRRERKRKGRKGRGEYQTMRPYRPWYM